MAMAEGLQQQSMMTHQAALAPQPPMNPPSMATMTHQTPANSYPLTERERPFACPDCEKAYPTAAGLCARAHLPSRCVPPAAPGSAACSPCRRAPRFVPQTSTSEAHTRTSSTHEVPPGRSPACSKCPAARG